MNWGTMTDEEKLGYLYEFLFESDDVITLPTTLTKYPITDVIERLKTMGLNVTIEALTGEDSCVVVSSCDSSDMVSIRGGDISDCLCLAVCLGHYPEIEFDATQYDVYVMVDGRHHSQVREWDEEDESDDDYDEDRDVEGYVGDGDTDTMEPLPISRPRLMTLQYDPHPVRERAQEEPGPVRGELQYGPPLFNTEEVQRAMEAITTSYSYRDAVSTDRVYGNVESRARSSGIIIENT